MKIEEIFRFLESWAPLAYQESYDNSGIQIGDPEDEFKGGLVCLDVSIEVLKEAVEKRCNLIVSHHPVLFHPLRQVVGKTLSEELVKFAIQHELNIYSAHTNLDNVSTGVNECLAKLLHISHVKPLQPKAEYENVGSGAYGFLAQPMSEIEFINHVKKQLNLTSVRCSIPHEQRKIRKVAICGGAGGFLLTDAVKHEVDAFVVGEVHYHDFVNYKGRLSLIEVGHFESESCIKTALFTKLNETFSTFAVSEKDESPYVYL